MSLNELTTCNNKISSYYLKSKYAREKQLPSIYVKRGEESLSPVVYSYNINATNLY